MSNFNDLFIDSRAEAAPPDSVRVNPSVRLPAPPPPEEGLRGWLRSSLTFVGLLPSDSGQDLVKRVIGIAGDRVACCDAQGRIVLNGVPLDEDYIIGPTDQVRFDIVVPPISILAEPPVALVDGVVDAKGTRKQAEAYLAFLYSEKGQTLAAKHHYRPAEPKGVPQALVDRFPKLELVSIDGPLFGGWAKAQPAHFGDGGTFDQLYKPAN